MTPRRWTALGAVVSVAGLLVAGTAPAASRAVAQPTAGGVLVVAGWAILAWGIHSFGRRG